MSDKATHASVNYGPGHKDGDHCAICKYYLKGPHCKRVLDPIKVLGWCRLFSEKQERKQ